MKWIKHRENQIFFSVTILTILIAVSPLLTRYTLIGHDSDYHLLRIEALMQQIKMGHPFLKVNTTYFGGAGYASSLFYPDFILFVPAILRAAGMSISFSYHTYMILCVFLCYIVSYACGKRLTGNRYIGILFAIIVTLSSYHLDDVIVRGAAGEYTAFIFVPIVLYGIYNLCYEDMNKPWILGLGMGLVLLSHTLTFMLCVVMILLMLLFNCDVFFKTPKLLLKLFATGIVTIVATAFYWIPVMEQFITTTFYVSKPWIEPAQEAVKLASVFGLKFPTLGIGLLLLVIPRVLIFRNHEDSVMKYADQCIASGIIFAVLASDIVPWERVGKYFSVVQFPWRFYVVCTVLLSLGAAIVIYRLTSTVFIGASDTPEEYDDEHQVVSDDGLINRYGVVIAIVLSIMAVSTIYTYSNQKREYFDYSNDYFSYKPFTTSVIAGEWLPVSVEDRDKLLEDSEHMYDNNGDELEFERVKNRIVFTASSDTEYVDVPFVYYKGYTAKGENGTRFVVDGNGENGLVRVYTNGINDVITVSYAGTIAQSGSLMISVLTIAILIVIAYKKLKNR